MLFRLGAAEFYAVVLRRFSLVHARFGFARLV